MKSAERQTKRARILLVDDHPLTRQALRIMIDREPDLEVCGEAESCETALEAFQTASPDLAIVDLGLKDSDGLDLVKEIHRLNPHACILVCSAQDEMVYAERVVRSGASGFISKQEPVARVLEAMRKVLDGEVYWSSQVARDVASSAARGRSGCSRWPDECLSERELQVFELIGAGTGTPRIAGMLQIDLSTVETYRGRIKQKLDLKDADDLLKAAIRWHVARAVGKHHTSI
jgi:DNA-binding NarL/FixJ family response regulator